MHYILILWIGCQGGHGVADLAQEFTSIEACEKAGKDVIAQANIFYSAHYVCEPR